jgi:hypothetical protein
MTTIGTIKRSAIYNLLNTTIAPINHKLKAKLDVLGSVIIVSLVVGTVFLVRFILSALQ